jgi:hypothetical protein
MGFKQIPRKLVGADLSRTPPIYRPLPAVPLPASFVRHGSNELGSSSPPARSNPVILSEAKDLAADRDKPFASRRRDTG